LPKPKHHHEHDIEKSSPQVCPLCVEQIVVAVDLSSHSEKTAAYAVEIAGIFGATIYLVYVYAPPQSLFEYTTQGFHEYLEQERYVFE
jgi:nucleotide-binding universal stress UspA family protein